MQNKKIWLSLAKMGGHEQKYIQEAFDTNWVVPLGPNVNAFEETLAEYIGEKRKVVALSSGTAAIHLALIQLGVQPGDEVICQSFTFVASANPIKYLGANPVFVGSEPDTWNMSPDLLRMAIEDRIAKTDKKPKAIIPVHLYGMPAKMDEIMQIAREFEIPVVEDAAEALGSELKGQKCGTFGDYACLSFNGNKIITTSGGGALVCKTREQSDRIKFFATQARDEAPHYQHSEIGYNYRMSNICAGIGRGQMTVLQDYVNRRREIHSIYKSLLKGVRGITVMDKPSEDFNSNFWLTCILVDKEKAGFDREMLRKKMDSMNIETRPLWKPMHLQPVFAESPYYGNGVEDSLFDNGLCLPSGAGLSNEEIEKVIGVILKAGKE
ncbi:MAG: aminotransferase class I/II-fold pyridoxal phosphate-dependent enzyme [Porphyromonadaceae bacterium]|nr:aminotransferase class I/II-fold pyridoxal phosphate-dependent enzyme [Porphyromonadaceae bacterium]